MKRRSFFSYLLTAFGIANMVPSLAKETSCLTDQDVQGPFHRPEAPFRFNLAENYNGNGQPILVFGKVFGNNCEIPLAGATIDLWHASPEGEYDMDSSKYLFRGRLKTNSQGYYQFKTLIPKGYKDGGLDRPKHIHFKVTGNKHRDLITQLYFEGDSKLNGDPFVIKYNGYKRVRSLKLNKDACYEMNFDIYLDSI